MPFTILQDRAESIDLDLSEYFIFTTIINPWKRMVSNFLYRKDDIKGTPWYHKHYDASTASRYSFFQYISNVLGGNKHLDPYWSGCGCPNLDNFTQNSNAKVYKIESFSTDILFTDIYNATGFELRDILKDTTLPFLNPTNPEKTKNYQQYYTEDWMIDKVAKIYKSDIEYGQYTFK